MNPESHDMNTGAARPGPVDASPQPSQKRSLFRRFVTMVGWLVMLLVIVGIVGFGFVETRLQKAGPIPRTGSGVFLIVGSDTREDLPEDLEGRFGDFAGERADVIILANPTGTGLNLLSLPRDLKVDIPGRGTDKINAAYTYGGLDLLAQTISANLSIPVGHAARVDFGGFASIVDAVGGVELDFEGPTRDLKSGLEVQQGGLQTVNGSTALAYVRSRSTEVSDGDSWNSLGGNDIDRTERQREVLSGIASSAASPQGIVRFPLLVNAVTSALFVDDGTHSWHLASLAVRMVLIPETNSQTLPVVLSTEGGVSYVVADGSAAANAVTEFAAK